MRACARPTDETSLPVLMDRDIRDLNLYHEVEAYFKSIHAPGAGVVTDACDVCVEPNGRRAALTGTVFETLTAAPVTRLCLVDLRDGALTQLHCPANNDRLPRWSPDGRWLAFLSDRRAPGDYQLYLAAADELDTAIETPHVDGVVEYLHWSPDGR